LPFGWNETVGRRPVRKNSSTLVLPANMADAGAMVALAMKVVPGSSVIQPPAAAPRK
jgi:hypothetical protein